MKLNHEVLNPQANETNDDLIILPGGFVEHVGGGYLTQRAQVLANQTGSRVLAYERAFSSDRNRFNIAARRRIQHEHGDHYKEVGAAVAKIADEVGYDELHGAGHSGGGFDMVSVAGSGELPDLSTLLASDPPCLKDQFIFKGDVIDYLWHTLWVEPRRPEGVDAVGPPNPARTSEPSFAREAMTTIGEFVIYGGVANTSHTIGSLARVATEMPHTRTRLIFLEHTFTETRSGLDGIQTYFDALTQNREQPFDVEIMEGRYHSYFDNYHAFGAEVAKFILDEEKIAA